MEVAGVGGELPDTGTRVSGLMLVGGVLMLLAGAAMITVVSRRGHGPTGVLPSGVVGIDDLL